MSKVVILHVSDAANDVARAVSTAAFMADSEQFHVQVIINGPAVAAVLKSSEVTITPSPGVEVFACERAMKSQGISSADLQREVGTVPSAVIALAVAQNDGAAYIRI